MNFVFQIAIENALLVALAAPLVWGVSRLVRRPALIHALWLIVLIKLLTPPLYRPTVPLPHRDAVPNETSRALDDKPIEHWKMDLKVLAPRRFTDATAVPSAPEPPIDVPQIFPSSSHIVHSFEAFISAVKIIWLSGSLVCLLIALTRIVRFSRGLRHAYPAPPELQTRVAKLSHRLGLRSIPVVHFIPAPLCPMLWAVGRSPRLLIPVALWGRLDVAERDSILLHELAHWRRRDHWVRWIELAATTIYWWNPICWWARRELREAEEQCCDAWVLHATGDFKPYANALLRAVEFISAPILPSPHHKPLPALASGMGQFNHLKRRIVMLKTASVTRALSPRTLVAALGFSAMLLPLSPSLKGQDQTPPATAARVATTPTQLSGVTDEPVKVNLPLTPGAILDDSASQEDQLKAARKEIQDLRQRLAQAEARLAMYKARENRAEVRLDRNEIGLDSSPSSDRQNKNAQLGADRVRDQAAKVDADLAAAKYRDDLARLEVRDGQYRTVITDPATGRIKEIIERPLPPPTKAAQQVDRLDKLEAQLQDLLKEIHSIRQQSTSSETHDIPAKK
jgi:beta-lactamase regulating signal transducer with metallopeptidase domain